MTAILMILGILLYVILGAVYVFVLRRLWLGKMYHSYSNMVNDSLILASCFVWPIATVIAIIIFLGVRFYELLEKVFTK